jgi:hypothetical protein
MLNFNEILNCESLILCFKVKVHVYSFRLLFKV